MDAITVLVPDELASKLADGYYPDTDCLTAIAELMKRAWRAQRRDIGGDAEPRVLRSVAGQRYEVMVRDTEGGDETLVEEITVAARSFDSLPLRQGTPLVVPESADLTIVLGVESENVRQITLDGSRWFRVEEVEMLPSVGAGKLLQARVPEPVLATHCEAGAVVSVPVTSIRAVGC
jgi:hypothetical protein